jgi:hypothetical protein
VHMYVYCRTKVLMVDSPVAYNVPVLTLFCTDSWLNFHGPWTPSHYETGSVIVVEMP